MVTAVKNINELNELVKEDSKKNKDFEVAPTQISWANGGLEVRGLGRFAPTKLCLDQLCSKVGIMPTTAQWLQLHHPAQFNQIMEKQVDFWAYSQKENKNNLLRLREVNGEMKARAILSDRYGIMDNHSSVQVLKDSLPSEFHGLKFNGIKNKSVIDVETGRMECRVLVPAILPGTETDEHSFGFVVSNDETGRGSLSVEAHYLRAFCTNQLRGLGNIAKYKHIGKDRFNSIESDFSELIKNTAVTANSQFAAYWNTRDKKVEDTESFLMQEGLLLKLPKKALKDIVETELLKRNVQETGSTVYSVIQSFTEYARDLDDAATAQLFEVAAGALAIRKG